LGCYYYYYYYVNYLILSYIEAIEALQSTPSPDKPAETPKEQKATGSDENSYENVPPKMTLPEHPGCMQQSCVTVACVTIAFLLSSVVDSQTS